jgi:hypothetical protein
LNVCPPVLPHLPGADHLGARSINRSNCPDVILALEGFFIGAGMDDQVTLGTACFVKSGAIQFGSYIYDEPSKENDPRIVLMGQVPAILFSETLADLRRIAETSAG